MQSYMIKIYQTIFKSLKKCFIISLFDVVGHLFVTGLKDIEDPMSNPLN